MNFGILVTMKIGKMTPDPETAMKISMFVGNSSSTMMDDSTVSSLPTMLLYPKTEAMNYVGNN